LLLVLPAAAENVEILRDPYGTPHIFATTPAGAAFAAGYTQAEDRIEALLRNLRGARSEDVDGFSPEMRAMLEAYAAGVNRYRPDAGVTAGQVAAFGGVALAKFQGASLFVDKTRSASGSVIAILDTQANWSADDRPYEMSLYITQGDVAVAGVAPLGVPFPVTGHSRTVAIAWSPGAGGLEQAWRVITARDVDGVRKVVGFVLAPLAAPASALQFDAVGANHVRVVAKTRLGRALERLEVHVEKAETARVALTPLEVVEQRPSEVAAQVHSLGQRASGSTQMVPVVGDATRIEKLLA